MDPRWERNETEKKVAKVLEEVAAEVGASNIQAGLSIAPSIVTHERSRSVLTDIVAYFLVAIAYVMQKVPYVFPIVGGRKVEQLHANLEALDIVLTDELVKKIEGAVPFDPGFPSTFVVSTLLDFSRPGFADGRARFRVTAPHTISLISS